MELVRALYERMHRVTRIYRALAVVGVLAALGLGGRLWFVHRREAASRLQAAEVFYQLKALQLEAARLRADTPERREHLDRLAALQADYDEWLRWLDESARGSPEERAVRAAVGRLGEARVLASDRFIRDVRRRIAKWQRTPDYARAVAAAQANGTISRVESVLTASALPAELVWVAYQESRFDPRAVGPVTRFGVAKGMWQLMPATARHYGLRTGPLVGQPQFDPSDQRHDPVRATDAAVRYLADLYRLDAQGSGLLVMACYNAGQTRVLRLLRSLPPTPRDRNFWRLLERHRDAVPDETYGYVVGVVAAVAVATEPATFGFARLARTAVEP
jgi:soluble lytic murein transglycosylase-like protein